MLTEKAVADVTVSILKEYTAPLFNRIAELEKQLAEMPTPQDGKDGKDGRDGSDGKDGAPGVDGVNGADGRDGIDGKDGDAGKDGIDGKDGRDGQPGRDGRDGSDGADGKDGAPGADGKDGLGFDDMSMEYDGERRLSLIFAKGQDERVFSFDLPMMLDRGIFSENRDYSRGDTVTAGGSIWIAQKDAPEGKPGMSDDWRLAVKKGRNARGA